MNTVELLLVQQEARALFVEKGAYWWGCLDFNIDHCGGCGLAYIYDSHDYIGRSDLGRGPWCALFGRQNCAFDEVFADYCDECARMLEPAMFRLYDIYELHLSVQRLARSINEKRKGNRNYRPAPGDACERREGRA